MEYTGIADASGNWSITINPALSDGSYSGTVTARDAAGNTSTATTFSLTIDSTAPSVPTGSANPNPTSGAVVITFTGTTSGDSYTMSGLSCIPTPSTGGTVTCSGTLTTSNPTVTVTDPAGNSGTGTVSAVLDTTAPTVTLL